MASRAPTRNEGVKHTNKNRLFWELRITSEISSNIKNLRCDTFNVLVSHRFNCDCLMSALALVNTAEIKTRSSWPLSLERFYSFVEG